jgi:hypothetical protein
MPNWTPGDVVILRFIANDVLPSQIQAGQLEVEAVMLHAPQGAGDHYVFRVDEFEFTLNPLVVGFVGVIKTNRKVKVVPASDLPPGMRPPGSGPGMGILGKN